MKTSEAISFVVGQHLFTRDGRVIGNAIITEVTSQGLIRMETDFGNGRSLLNTAEVNEWWYTTDSGGYVRVSNLSQWRKDREECRTTISLDILPAGFTFQKPCPRNKLSAQGCEQPDLNQL